MNQHQESSKNYNEVGDDHHKQPYVDMEASPNVVEDGLRLAPAVAASTASDATSKSPVSGTDIGTSMRLPSVDRVEKSNNLRLAPGAAVLSQTTKARDTRCIGDDPLRLAPPVDVLSSTSNASDKCAVSTADSGTLIGQARGSSAVTSKSPNNLEPIPGAFQIYATPPSNEDRTPGRLSVQPQTVSYAGDDDNTDPPAESIIAHLVTETESKILVVAEKLGASVQSVKICGVPRKIFIFSLIILIIIVVNVSLVGVLSGKRSKASSMTGPSLKIFTEPILSAIKERGSLRCYAYRFEIMQGKGMSIDLCRAIAAAIFGDPEGALDYIDFIDMPFGEHFAALWNGTIDISTNYVYYTMKRDVFEPSTGLPLSYSTPWFNSGNMFAGRPEFVDCADRLDTLVGVCRDLSICVSKGTAHVDVVDKYLPGIQKHELLFTDDWYKTFVNGTCNVYIVDQVGWTGDLYEPILREFGFEGEYVIGKRVHSSDQLTMISKGDDQEWADFCNSILRGLITAEALNITQEIALSPSLWSVSTSLMADNASSVFDDEYKNAIAAVGNYGELYERHYGAKFPRDGLGRINSINSGDSGVMRSSQFGVLTVDHEKLLSLNHPLPSLISGGTLESIVKRGVLRCGVIGSQTKYAFLHSELGNDKEENTTITMKKEWTGIDVEYCRAIAASIFTNQCLFPDEDFNENDQNRCIVFVDVGTNIQDGYIALDKDEIDVFAGGSITVLADMKEATTGKGFTFTPPYYYYDDDVDDVDSSNTFDNSFSRVNRSIGRSLVTRDTDWQWSAFVRWITIAIVYAEEEEITQDNVFDMPVVDLFGSDFVQMFRDAIFAVGNYGELFNRTMNYPHNITRKGRNLVNADRGPQFVPIPLL